MNDKLPYMSTNAWLPEASPIFLGRKDLQFPAAPGCHQVRCLVNQRTVEAQSQFEQLLKGCSEQNFQVPIAPPDSSQNSWYPSSLLVVQLSLFTK